MIRILADDETVNLVYVCLRSTYFSYHADIYEQINGVEIGSPLSLIVANIFMEHFEDKAINSPSKKPQQWWRYVDDTHFIWSHGKDKLGDFLIHINKQLEDIKFTMEIEEDNSLPFLYILLSRKEDGFLAHQVYRKKMHVDKCIRYDSHHHLTQNISIINTLTIRAKRIFDFAHLDIELEHLTKIFKNNSYSENLIRKTIKRSQDARQAKCWCICNFGMYSSMYLMYCNPMFIPGCSYYVFESCDHTLMFRSGRLIM